MKTTNEYTNALKIFESETYLNRPFKKKTMQVLFSNKNPTEVQEALAVGIFKDSELHSSVKEIDSLTSNLISELIKTKEFEPDLNYVRVLNTDLSSKRLILIGLGKKEEYELDVARQFASSASRTADKLKLKSLSLLYDCLEFDLNPQDLAQAITEGSHLGIYTYEVYKSQPKEKTLNTIKLVSTKNKNEDEIKTGIVLGELISDSVNYVRDLVNTPSTIKNPDYIARQSKEIAKKHKLKIKVFDEKDMKKQGMNAILAVGASSENKPRLIIIEYGNPKKHETIVLVGKGITFDSGGLGIKPADGMLDMKDDMSGVAVILGAMKILSKLKLPLHIVALLPCAENMITSTSYRPGDYIKTYSGKTIDIQHTDAEGRVVLSDALAYSKNFKPAALIDLATLTGAALVALGSTGSALFTNNEELKNKLLKASDKTSERLWPMPIWKEHSEMIKSKFADFSNLGSWKKEGGCVTAAAFLKEFVPEGVKWAHIDMAGPVYQDKESAYSPVGATGYGVRLIVELLRDWA